MLRAINTGISSCFAVHKTIPNLEAVTKLLAVRETTKVAIGTLQSRLIDHWVYSHVKYNWSRGIPDFSMP